MIITLLRKPLDGSVAENTLQHGCGAINIDATRVSTSDNLNGGAYAENPTERGGEYEQPSGRWPANFILTHLEGCALRGTTKIKQGKSSNTLGGADRKVGLYKDGLKKEAENRYRGEEEVADWACPEGCPIKILDEQSGFQKSGVAGSKSRAWGVAGKGQLSSTEDGVGWKAYGSEGYGDEGGASRFFMQFKKDSEE
jgi:hypothetical protein